MYGDHLKKFTWVYTYLYHMRGEMVHKITKTSSWIRGEALTASAPSPIELFCLCESAQHNMKGV